MRDSEWSHNHKEVEEKSEIFLKRIIGDDKFNALQKNGKIEIEINIKNNEKTVYELYSDGKLINKTKNQSYCIVADRSDYPTNDMVAIKYAWLTCRNDIAEKAANKTSLNTWTRTNRDNLSTGYADFINEMEQRGWSRQSIVVGSSPNYGDFVDHLSVNSWERELIVINEHSAHLVDISSVQSGDSHCIIDIKCPIGTKMTFMGRNQIPADIDINTAYSLGLYITDENGKEIPDNTKIRITKNKTCEEIVQLARIYYSDVKMENGKSMYSFNYGIELNSENHLMVHVVNSECNIPDTGIKFELESDIWIRNI